MFKDKRLSKIQVAQWNEAAKLLTRQRLQENSIPDDQQSHWVWVRNDSGSARERYECMTLSDPIFNLDLDGSVDLMFKAIASDPAKTPVILLEPIASGEMGKGIINGLALAKVGSGPTTATVATPGTHKLTPGSGSIKLLGAPSASVDKLLPVLLGAGSGGDAILFTTRAGGIAARSTTTLPHTFPSATVDLLDPVTGDVYSPNQTATVYNSTNIAVAHVAYRPHQAKKIGSRYFIDVDDCS